MRVYVTVQNLRICLSGHQSGAFHVQNCLVWKNPKVIVFDEKSKKCPFFVISGSFFGHCYFYPFSDLEKAHRCVIASASERLKNTVFSPIEVTKLTLDWSSMDLDVVDSLLLYIYTGRVNRSNLTGLKAAGEFFDIRDLNRSKVLKVKFLDQSFLYNVYSK